MSALFSALQIGALELPNRIVVSPMCQYSAREGQANEWHMQHLMQLALSGAGLVMVEATAVEPRGRISHGCLGLYSDATEAALARVLAAARAVAAPQARLGIQLAHAGRKGAADAPWLGGRPLAPQAGAWRCVAPSATPFAEGWPTPQALDEEGIAGVIEAFGAAARRAARLGFDVVELHAGHGYLLHQFQSPLANARTDAWGGTAAGRQRLALAVARRMREALPAGCVLGARITGTDWLPGGLDIEDAVSLAGQLRQAGADYVCVTSGFVVRGARIPFGPGYQAGLAEQVRRRTGMPVRAVGGIADPRQAQAIIETGQADQVALARAFLADPRWVWRAAETLGAPAYYAPQYRLGAGLRA
ncbi:NADH:flavin oxidoreductase/NADH oxidase [Bordetella bronchiseptica]|uniref:NADH:flavin oxidoreductase/NADH oxidase n=1 Tax=Bordetella bronchiseptica TaxID=518 RepID=UPI000461FDA4|nr:NADH:flavin oxidoreductase/NADH oxidase [Bordetella bronchiseptica]AZW11533.1 NADH:flavin oxidoreductase/NADH oxidase [Bordetella bronchiseptica]KDC67624.1 oxidoreductase, FAD/FMN dependent [Bordetella bronchiseptica MBORD624]KDD04039.1 oxidoreductase, FAD/FMN dependent [Bordetella bronchiseptica MBORD681]KDD07273.1 oxidoreductase, FAD/FMN dependent [Bordetella bronchiseptica MBORD698]KDD12177.1 oxidoreductase, FAD/FMN dependent [Bordetella bronchiseptica MBORD731]